MSTLKAGCDHQAAAPRRRVRRSGATSRPPTTKTSRKTEGSQRGIVNLQRAHAQERARTRVINERDGPDPVRSRVELAWPARTQHHLHPHAPAGARHRSPRPNRVPTLFAASSPSPPRARASAHTHHRHPATRRWVDTRMSNAGRHGATVEPRHASSNAAPSVRTAFTSFNTASGRQTSRLQAAVIGDS